MIKFKVWIVGFAWDVGKQILADIGISQYLDAAYSQIDSNIYAFMVFFRIPEAINIIISSAATKFVLRFLGVS